MIKSSITLITIFFLALLNCYGQPKNRLLKKVKQDNTCILYANEQDQGLLLNWSEFTDEKFVAQTESQNGETIMLLGSATYLYSYLKQKYADFSVDILKPKSAFQIKFQFNGTEIEIHRKFNNSAMWSDNYAHQRPENYWLIYSFNSNDEKLDEAIEILLKYFTNSFMEFTQDCSPNISFKSKNIKSNETVTFYIYDQGEHYYNYLKGAYHLKLNDSIICKVTRGKPQKIDSIKPGKYILSAKSTEINVDLKGGEQYFIRCGTYETSPLVNKPKIQVVVPEFGRQEFHERVRNIN